MASTDPKKTRDIGPTSDRENYDADEDPLVELARIVSEDAGFSSRMTKKPNVERAPPPPVEEALSSVLEAELMQELETSFSARQAPPAAARAGVPAEPVHSRQLEEPVKSRQVEEPVEPEPMHRPGPDEDNPEDLLRSIEQQLSQFEQRVRSDSFVAEDDGPVVEGARSSATGNETGAALEADDDWQEVSQPAAARTDYRFRGPASADWERPDEREDDVSAPDERLDVPTSVADAGPAADLFGRLDLTQDGPYDDHLDHERPDETDEGAAGADWAAPDHRAPNLAGLEAELSRELEPSYGGRDTDRWQDSDDGAQDQAHVAAAAVIATEHGMRPPPRPAALPPRSRSRKGLVTAASILMVVVLGGAGAMYFRSWEQASSGPPPVIAAPEGPVKIEPAQTPSDAGEETVGEAVYNRVAGRAPDTEENVVEGAEEPREIARIVLPRSEGESEEPAPGPAEGEAAGTEAEAQPAEGQGSAEEFGPRRVPTFVVRPDGTIVATSEAERPAGTADLSGQDMATAQTEAMEPKPVQTVTIDEPRTAGTPASPAATESAPALAAENLPPAPIARDTSPAEAEEATVPPPFAEEEPTEEAGVLAALEQPQELMADTLPAEEGAEELDVGLADPEPAPAELPPTAASGYVVQISSQTSLEAAEATFAGLQQRHASILGDLEADIQRADLDKGTFYRVRVGPWAERGEAIEVCEALKTAGADCYVTQ